jgi:hypothetical protein
MANDQLFFDIADLPIVSGTDEDINQLGNHVAVISGKRKLGKSSTAATYPRPLFLDFEKRSGFLNTNRIYMHEKMWFDNQFMPIESVPKGKRLETVFNTVKRFGASFKADAAANIGTIVVDTVDRFWEMCVAAYLYDTGQEMKGVKTFTLYNAIYPSFKPIIEKYNAYTEYGYNVVYVCHCDTYWNEEHKRDAYKLCLPPELDRHVTSLSTLNMCLVPDDRGGAARLYCKSHPCFPSGDGTGRMPLSIPATYGAICEAFAHGDPEQDQFQPQITTWLQPQRADDPKKIKRGGK